jgi:hypothetical protein
MKKINSICFKIKTKQNDSNMKNLFILVLLLALIILTGCQEKSNPVKPDPCEGKIPVSAEFHIYEQPGYIPDEWELYDTDTLNTTSILFVAIGHADEYEWYIGSEILNGKSVFRQNFPRGVKIPIMMIARGVPDTACFPYDDGIDTLMRILYVNRIMENYVPCIFEFDLFSGDYTGYNLDNPKDTFTITIDACYPHRLDIKIFRLINLIPNCEIIFNPGVVSYNGYRRWLFGISSGYYECLTPRGIAKIYGRNNDSIRIEYKIQQAPGWEYFHKERINKEFIGVRVK